MSLDSDVDRDAAAGTTATADAETAEGSDRRAFRRLVAQRLVTIPIVLIIVSILVFVATQALPGDAARAIAGRDATPARLAELRHELGTNRPLVNQYGGWVRHLATGDLGTSLASRRPVSTVLGGRVMNSLALLAITAVVALPAAILLGIWSAVRRGSKLERASSALTLVLASLPEFVVGVALIVLFATGFTHLLPAISTLAPGQTPLDVPKVVVLPALALILLVVPYVTRMVRAAVADVLDRDYVEMARLKGMPERTVLRRHVLTNALAPIAQVCALVLAVVAGGSVVIETLFGYPGIGLTLVEAIRVRDLPVIQVLSLGIAGLYVMVALLADVVGLAVTPRARTAAA